MKSAVGRGAWGLCLVCLGGVFLYGSLDAIQQFFLTGEIAWGTRPRRFTGEMALMAHGAFVLAGACMAAEGIRQIMLSRSFER